MSTTTSFRSRNREKPDDGSRPCRSCGVIVRHPDPARTEVVHIYRQMTAGMVGHGPFPRGEMEATRCDECAKRRELARTLLAEHPRVARTHGNVGIDRLDAALAALDLGGFRGSRVATFTGSDDALHELMDALAGLGAAASWSLRAGTVGATGKRWGHVSRQLAQDAAEAHRALVHRISEVPMPYVPPGSSDGKTMAGCLFCGVGTLTARQREAREAWGDQRRVNAAAIGGRTRPEPISGHLCPACRAAIDAVGSPGIPAVQRAMLAHLGYVIRLGYTLDFPMTLAWAATTRTEPNAKPWGHLDLERMKRKLADLENRMYVRREVRR